jgi:hypothetical protein
VAILENRMDKYLCFRQLYPVDDDLAMLDRFGFMPIRNI